ncbi:MAG TPA: SDR family oxidoreductase, partial [Planctomycetota bacterium]|nr:SDR family oxidoreductase [Planctomycetota bacterium]
EHPGRIVFLGSWAGHAAHPGIPAYCAAKAGLRMLMKCLALELSEYRILVNEVAPGYVDAGLSGRWFERNPADRERARTHVPIQTLISAHDVALQVAHLCDPANTQMTGSVLLMDGGLSLITPAYGGPKRAARKAIANNRGSRRLGKGAVK